MSLPSSLGQAAEALAQMGLSVFPLWPRAKTPMTHNGFKAATKDLAQVRLWWERSPAANIGVAVPNDVVVVDVDNAEAMNALLLEGEFPETVETKTPRGFHLWFRLPGGVRVHPRVGAIPGVDVRAFGSYVVAPPSVNDKGVHWSWRTAPAIDRFSFIPNWLLQLLTKREPTAQPTAAVLSSSVLNGVSEGQRDSVLFRYACKLRGQGRDRKEAEVLVCHAAAHCSPPFPGDEAFRKVEQAWRFPGTTEPDSAEDVRIWSALELLHTDFTEPSWFVENLLPEGLTLVVSPAKVGKSFLVGNVSAAIAHGGTALGSLATQKAGVLYLDLEESESRAKRRWRNILGGDEIPPTLYTAFRWPRLHDGGLERLDAALTERPEIGVLVIDVLSKFWPPDADNGSGNAYHREYKILSEIKDFAQKRRLAAVLVHHTNRAAQLDPLDRVSGTNAMTGVPDVIWILKRDRGKSSGELYITGRSVEEDTLAMTFSPAIGSWCIDKPTQGWKARA